MQRFEWISHLFNKQSKSFHKSGVSGEVVQTTSPPNTEMRACFKNTFSGELNNLQMEIIYSKCYTFAGNKKIKLNFDGKKMSKVNDKKRELNDFLN